MKLPFVSSLVYPIPTILAHSQLMVTKALKLLSVNEQDHVKYQPLSRVAQFFLQFELKMSWKLFPALHLQHPYLLPSTLARGN